MRREPTNGHTGPVEICLEDGERVGSGTGHFRSWVHIIDDEGTTGTRGWDGTVTGLHEDVLPGPLQVMVTIRTPEGREARARMRGSRIVGVGEPPFDVN